MVKSKPLSECLFPRGDMVLVRRTKLSSVIAMPEGAGVSNIYATVVRTGPGIYNRQTGKFDAFDIQAGDKVMLDMEMAQSSMPPEFREENLALVPHQAITAIIRDGEAIVAELDGKRPHLLVN